MNMAILNSNKIITLYHGSTHLFNEIDVSKGKPFKDFGKGFYTTQNKDHAINLALRNKRIEEVRLMQKEQKRNINVNAYLYTYELDKRKTIGLSIKEFVKADKKWILFVLANYKSIDKTHVYDIVVGPTADDDTRLSLRAYFSGAYGEIESNKAINVLIDNIKPDNLPKQAYFGTSKGTSLLIQKGDAMLISTKESIQFAIDTLTTEVVQKYSLDNNITGTEALRFFMKTDTFKLLINPESYLYLESLEYVLDMLDAEMHGDTKRWLEA
ncbi:MAG: DUF3990 domain-containing protein [Oscillospiraceae bacterium]|nr:DUF3990 domain-containing protein [Oscillospiraceae bacterium]